MIRPAKKASYRFETTCEHCPDVRLLEAMEDRAVEITYRTARKHLGELLDFWAVRHGYVLDPRRGLTLKKDYHVRYYRSWYGGRRCIDVDWSAIDNIFVKEG